MPRYKLSLEIVVEADSTDQAIRWLRRLLENTDMAEHDFVKEFTLIGTEDYGGPKIALGVPKHG